VYYSGPKPKSEASIKRAVAIFTATLVFGHFNDKNIDTVNWLRTKGSQFSLKALHEAILCKIGVHRTPGINNSFLCLKDRTQNKSYTK